MARIGGRDEVDAYVGARLTFQEMKDAYACEPGGQGPIFRELDDYWTALAVRSPRQLPRSGGRTPCTQSRSSQTQRLRAAP